MQEGIGRRRFVGGALAAGGAAVLPAHAWARVGGANETLRVGVIGCGTQGMFHIRDIARRASQERVVVHRVCDVYQTRLEEAKRAAALPSERASMEYREVLDDPDIDAIIVATPDHWHGKMAIDGLGAGKSVLLETPFAHTVEEALALRDAALASSKVLAVGARAASDARYREIRRMVLQSKLGKVSWSQASFCKNFRMPIFNRRRVLPLSPIPGTPEHVWWDRWLGHQWGLAPVIPLDAERFFRFPKYFDYSGGLLSEFLFNELAGLLYAISGRKGEQPRSVVCGGGRYNIFDERDTPDQVFAVIEYPSEHTVTLAASAASESALVPTVRGRHATVEIADEGLRVSEQSDFYPEFRNVNRKSIDAGMVRNDRGQWVPDPPRGEARYVTEMEPTPNVTGNFLAAVRGDAEPNCGAELGCAASIAITLAVDAFRDRATKHWDPKAETPVES